jgi:hypothetical protein
VRSSSQIHDAPTSGCAINPAVENDNLDRRSERVRIGRAREGITAPMAPSTRRIPDLQREVIRKRHEAELDALADYAIAADRLATTEARRLEVIAEQDQQVATARSDLALSIRALVGLVGVETVATLSDLSVAAVRRSLRETDPSEAVA